MLLTRTPEGVLVPYGVESFGQFCPCCCLGLRTARCGAREHCGAAMELDLCKVLLMRTPEVVLVPDGAESFGQPCPVCSMHSLRWKDAQGGCIIGS